MCASERPTESPREMPATNRKAPTKAQAKAKTKARRRLDGVVKRIYMSRALEAALKRVASQEETSVSAIVRSLCLHGLRRRGVTLA
jgi:hypothetical protein